MTNDYSLSKGKQQNSSNHVSSEREERFFANFVTASTTAEENGLPELVSPLTSSSAAYYIQDTKQVSFIVQTAYLKCLNHYSLILFLPMSSYLIYYFIYDVFLKIAK
jgi:hypothetical protein